VRPEFKERLILRGLLLLKWPVIILTIYLVFPSSLVSQLSDFIQVNNIKKFEASPNGVSVEVDTAQAIKNIENAQEIKRIAGELAAIKELGAQKSGIKDTLKEVEAKSDEIIKSSISAFSKNTNRNHVVGNVMTSIAEFQFTVEKKGETDILLKVFIDGFPYSNNFDLCSKEGHYKFPRNIKINKNESSAEVSYIDEKTNCQSRVEVTKLRNGQFLYSYDLNILDGYNIAKVQGFDALLPLTMKRMRGNVIYDPESDNVVSSKFVNDQLVQREIVNIKVY